MVEQMVMMEETIILPRLPRHLSCRGSATTTPKTPAERRGMEFRIPKIQSSLAEGEQGVLFVPTHKCMSSGIPLFAALLID